MRASIRTSRWKVVSLCRAALIPLLLSQAAYSSEPVISTPATSAPATSAPATSTPANLEISSVEISSAEISSAEISRLLTAGDQAYDASDYKTAANYYQQALTLIEARELSGAAVDLDEKQALLYILGYLYYELSDYEAAKPLIESALEAYRFAIAEDDLLYADVRADMYSMLSVIAQSTGGYATALGYSQSALALTQASDRPEKTAGLHHNIGAIEADIGQYENAQASLQAAIELSQQIGILELEASAVFALGWVQERQENFEAAIASYQSALSLFSSLRQQTGIEQTAEKRQDSLAREARTYNNLGIVYLKQNDAAAAAAAFNQGLSLLEPSSSENTSIDKALLLDSIGSLRKSEGDVAQAWASYWQAWQLSKQNSETTAGEVALLLNLGELMEMQAEPALAIFFYKQAIAQIEATRADLRQLSQSVQQQYTKSVESAYRTLAALLLQQGREAEALQVLELLKLQEVKSYLHNEGEGRTAGAQQFNTAAETALLRVFYALPAETSLSDFVTHPAAIALKTAPESRSTTEELFSLQAVDALRVAIAQQPVKTAALYPLILEDRLEILLLTPAGNLERFTTDVSQTELSAIVRELQNTLQTKALNPKPAAQQLYQWLIAPIRDVLTAQQVESIIYLPDSVLRYVPLATLHDGKQWFAESYQSHTITAATVGDLTSDNRAADQRTTHNFANQSEPLGVMAGAFTDSSVVYKVTVGEQSFAYPGLSAAQQEIDNLQQALPESEVLLNENFGPENLLAGVGDRSILHLATHAQFISGEPEDSFILFGNGRTVNLRELKEWHLPNVDLVVLSACQTASSTEGDGKEILGFGYQVQSTGANAAIASLWSVDDSATAALMSQFYKHLTAGKTKADALRSAQQDLINTPGYDNPYDWAGFILIGNGL